MNCEECTRLAFERQKRERTYLNALGDLTAASRHQYLTLRTLVREAESDLTRADAEFRQHQDRHELPKLNARS